MQKRLSRAKADVAVRDELQRFLPDGEFPRRGKHTEPGRVPICGIVYCGPGIHRTPSDDVM